MLITGSKRHQRQESSNLLLDLGAPQSPLEPKKFTKIDLFTSTFHRIRIVLDHEGKTAILISSGHACFALRPP